jgi:hypothetical protein
MTLVIPDTTEQVFAVTNRTASPIYLEYKGVMTAALATLSSRNSYVRICYYPSQEPMDLVGDYDGNSLVVIGKFKADFETSLKRLTEVDDYIILHTQNGRITIRLD